jgi:hypothetical protein
MEQLLQGPCQWYKTNISHSENIHFLLAKNTENLKLFTVFYSVLY